MNEGGEHGAVGMPAQLRIGFDQPGDDLGGGQPVSGRVVGQPVAVMVRRAGVQVSQRRALAGVREDGIRQGGEGVQRLGTAGVQSGEQVGKSVHPLGPLASLGGSGGQHTDAIGGGRQHTIHPFTQPQAARRLGECLHQSHCRFGDGRRRPHAADQRIVRIVVRQHPVGRQRLEPADQVAGPFQ